VDWGPACPAIAINKGMDGLELRVRHSRLGNGGKCVVVAEAAKVLKQVEDAFRRGRDKCCRAGVVVTTSDPVLFRPNTPRVGLQSGTAEEPLVEVKKSVDGDRISRHDLLDCRCHRFDVPQYLGSRHVSWLFAQVDGRLCSEQTTCADLKSFDA